MHVANRPKLSHADAEAAAERLYGLAAKAEALPSERDQNFKLTAKSSEQYVLKIAHPDERQGILEFENAALERLSRTADANLFPRVLPTRDGELLTHLQRTDGPPCFVRLISFLPGTLLAKVPAPSPVLLRHLGTTIGNIDRALSDFRHPAMTRFMQWDAAHAPIVIRENLERIADAQRRSVVQRYLSGFEQRSAPRLLDLRRSVIHNDMNDHNILVSGERVSGIVDFGDMLHSYTVNDLAIACAYAMLGKSDPLEVASEIVSGYCRSYPLTAVEMEVLADFIFLRLCLSISISAKQQQQEPDNPYLTVSERPAWQLLERFVDEDMHDVSERLLAKLPRRTITESVPDRDATTLLALRKQLIGYNLSVSYRNPLKIVRGERQYLFDEVGRRYLDGVNNVCHVGHCHPRVTAAALRQMELLNTNTRYLHDNIIEYARRLTETLPAPVRVCYFVNSGSEANELALRLARTHTGRRDVLVVDYAYHGQTQNLIDISPYKFKRKGGKGQPSTTHVAPIPDIYRGPYKAADPEAGRKYALDVVRCVEELQRNGTNLAAFILESQQSCAGQVILPDGYLPPIFAAVRTAGGVCIADEVQVGFGRVGTHMWAFETQGIVPDIMTFGKPAGNGHPLAGVVTTPEIAASFANGMEYFNTFGGNPVSCAIGLEVLNVLRDEGLQAHALDVGNYMLSRLRELQPEFSLVGDVRGLGLFVGVEMVKDPTTLEPATKEANDLVNRMRERRFLLSTDGPFDNVIKLKPPMTFDRGNVDELVEGMRSELRLMK